VAKEELIENEEVVAFDAVPNTDPVIPPEIILIEPERSVSEPVIIALPLNGKIVVALFAKLDVNA
jgi:hypothetical protein